MWSSSCFARTSGTKISLIIQLSVLISHRYVRPSGHNLQRARGTFCISTFLLLIDCYVGIWRKDIIYHGHVEWLKFVHIHGCYHHLDQGSSKGYTRWYRFTLKLQEDLIGFHWVPCSHTGGQLAQAFIHVLDCLSITDKVSSAVMYSYIYWGAVY